MRASTARTEPARGAMGSTLMTALAAGLAAGVLAGCAATPDATWSDPQLGAKPLQGARVLVVCEANETTLQQVCLDRMAEEATARGLTPVRSAPSGSGVGRGAQAYVGAARAAGASALLLTSVTPDATQVVRPAPFSIGIGGFGGGSRVGVGAGVSLPIGGGGVSSNPGFAANSSFTEVGSGRLLWSARASSSNSDFNSGMGDMARTLLGAAEKAGVF
ncbi:hypothetical protein [Azohydromonas caseinilytica]|uniref:Uncharacterized protein n=1 Tax=Azohydromonas caseinilytica TaxID=2728836 RepID=A0A848F172_9BURK|nr:hypothetical protein [Azohydromonas caseinilytica]NML13827.1 hypothetical protein [Azohydromonas caseinilytica]